MPFQDCAVSFTLSTISFVSIKCTATLLVLLWRKNGGVNWTGTFRFQKY